MWIFPNASLAGTTQDSGDVHARVHSQGQAFITNGTRKLTDVSKLVLAVITPCMPRAHRTVRRRVHGCECTVFPTTAIRSSHRVVQKDYDKLSAKGRELAGTLLTYRPSECNFRPTPHRSRFWYCSRPRSNRTPWSTIRLFLNTACRCRDGMSHRSSPCPPRMQCR